EPEGAEVVGHRGVGGAEVEGDPRGGGAAHDLHVVGESVLGAQVRHLAGHEGAEAPRHLLVLAQQVDVVVDHGGDGDPIDLGEREHQSTRASSRYITLWRVVFTHSSICSSVMTSSGSMRSQLTI